MPHIPTPHRIASCAFDIDRTTVRSSKHGENFFFVLLFGDDDDVVVVFSCCQDGER